MVFQHFQQNIAKSTGFIMFFALQISRNTLKPTVFVDDYGLLNTVSTTKPSGFLIIIVLSSHVCEKTTRFRSVYCAQHTIIIKKTLGVKVFSKNNEPSKTKTNPTTKLSFRIMFFSYTILLSPTAKKKGAIIAIKTTRKEFKKEW